jgi:hypothetical protein
MELIRYLERHFFTREQLLARSATNAAQLERLHLARVMPQPSYRLRLDLGCDSFFGPHVEQVAADYYAKGYAAWLGQVATLGDEDSARALFSQRYRARLAQLAASGLVPDDPAFATDRHLQAEWMAFLDGTYGLCTVSGLPEDVAAKEAAISVIRDTNAGGVVNGAALERLRRAVDLLDSVSAAFAPHEVARSSRRRYVDGMRAAHGLGQEARAA